MVDLPVSKPKPKKPALPIGVMPNYAYNKTQFNDLEIHKDIEPFLDPLARLGWHLYTTGNLEIRNVSVPKNISVSAGGTYYNPDNQRKYDTLTGEKVTKDATFDGKLPIDSPFRSDPNIAKIVNYLGDRREGQTVYEDQLTLVHELRHAGLDYLNKLTQQGEQKQVKDYEIKYESKKYLDNKDPQKTEHKEIDDALHLFNSRYKDMSQDQSAEESLFTIMDFLSLRNKLDMETFDESGSEEDIEKLVPLHPAYDSYRKSSGYFSALELYSRGLSPPNQFSLYQDNPNYESARTWAKQVDSNIASLNKAATRQLDMLEGKKNVEQKSIVPKKDVGVIKTFFNLILGK